ncbi:hypothetical protein F5X96DRAFT_669672 [Biscogniauxia mediterranea]|nr:hypothetical protein F5X96DRAFT_669672 [Biscogniauxia mediterranea]
MEDTVESVLCDKTWRNGPDSVCDMRFRKDGTGDYAKFFCFRELCVFIGSVFEWKLQEGSTPLDRAMDAGDNSSAELHIQLTLTKRRALTSGWDPGRAPMNEDYVTDEAFLPRNYIIRLEKGRFSVTNGYTSSYGLRLLFDTSPAPPPELWKQRRRAAENLGFHEILDYYADGLS